MNIAQKYIEILIKIPLYLIESLMYFLAIGVLCGNWRDTLVPPNNRFSLLGKIKSFLFNCMSSHTGGGDGASGH